jgi:hypothetical protein
LSKSHPGAPKRMTTGLLASCLATFGIALALRSGALSTAAASSAAGRSRRNTTLGNFPDALAGASLAGTPSYAFARAKRCANGDRFARRNRYGTAALVGTHQLATDSAVLATGGNFPDTPAARALAPDGAVVATGESWPDALAAGALAALATCDTRAARRSECRHSARPSRYASTVRIAARLHRYGTAVADWETVQAVSPCR